MNSHGTLQLFVTSSSNLASHRHSTCTERREREMVDRVQEIDEGKEIK